MEEQNHNRAIIHKIPDEFGTVGLGIMTAFFKEYGYSTETIEKFQSVVLFRSVPREPNDAMAPVLFGMKNNKPVMLFVNIPVILRAIADMTVRCRATIPITTLFMVCLITVTGELVKISEKELDGNDILKKYLNFIRKHDKEFTKEVEMVAKLISVEIDDICNCLTEYDMKEYEFEEGSPTVEIKTPEQKQAEQKIEFTIGETVKGGNNDSQS